MKGREKISRRTFLKAAAAGIGGMTLAMKGKAIAQEKPKPARIVLGVEVIKIGGQGVISGAHADYGCQIQAGTSLAIEEINAKGGILGSKLELKFMVEELKQAVAVKTPGIWPPTGAPISFSVWIPAAAPWPSAPFSKNSTGSACLSMLPLNG